MTAITSTDPRAFAVTEPRLSNPRSRRSHCCGSGSPSPRSCSGSTSSWNWLVDWRIYLAPQIDDLVPGNAHQAMLAVGVIEIIAGIVVAVRPKFGGYLVAAARRDHRQSADRRRLLRHRAAGLRAPARRAGPRPPGDGVRAAPSHEHAMTRRTLAIVGASMAGAKAAEAARDAGTTAASCSSATSPGRRTSDRRSRRRSCGARPSRNRRGSTRRTSTTSTTSSSSTIKPSLSTPCPEGSASPGAPRSDSTAPCSPPGAEPRHLGGPGPALAGIYHLRTVDDSLILRDALRRAHRVAVVGAGWIGSRSQHRHANGRRRRARRPRRCTAPASARRPHRRRLRPPPLRPWRDAPTRHPQSGCAETPRSRSSSSPTDTSSRPTSSSSVSA